MEDRRQPTSAPSPAARLGSGRLGSGRLGERPAARGRPVIWLLLVASLLLLLFNWGPREISNWCLAGASEKELDGDYEAARDLTEKALEWDPANLNALHLQAKIAAAGGKPAESLGALKALHRLHPPNVQTLPTRANAYTRLKQYQLAIEDWKTIRKLSGPRVSPNTLNTLAYLRSQSGRELDAALKDIRLAIASLSGDRIVADITGFRLYNQAVQLERKARETFFGRQEHYKKVIRALTGVLTHCRLRQIWYTRTAALGNSQSKLILPQYKEFTASVLLHRARIYTAMELPKQAAADREFVTEKMKLNIKEVPSFAVDEVRVLSNLAMYLDTRGWVYFRQNKLPEALRDINNALRMYKVSQSNVSRRKQQVAQTLDTRLLLRAQRQGAATMAELLLHRAQIYRRLKRPKRAEADEERVRKLGIDPDNPPF